MIKIKKHILIISIVFFTVILYFFGNPIYVFASTAGDNLLGEVSSGANSFLQMGQNGLGSMGVSIDMSLITGIAQLLYFVCCVAAIGGTIYKAVKYGMSSPEERATAKRGLIGWVIICFLLIGAYPVYRLIVTALDDSSFMEDIASQFEGTSQGLSGASQNSTFILILNTIFRVIQVGAIGYIIIRFTIVGIRYFTSQAAKDRVEERGELYRTLILAIIIFGAAGFFEIIYQAIN